MGKKMLLLKAFLKREFILFKRYFFNSVGGIITFYIIFLLIFWGYKGVGGGNVNFGTMIEGLIVGYIMWLFALMVYQDFTYTIQREAREGTLEQLYMSVHSFAWVMAMKTLAQLLINLILIIVMLFLLMITTGKFLNLDLLSLIPIVFFTLLSVLGLGYIFGGLTLVFKRIENYLQIIQFALIALIIAPVNRIPLLRFLPASWGANLVRQIMVDGKSIVNFSFQSLLLLVIVAFVYLFIGYSIYKLCENKAMNEGMLGHY